MTTGEKQIQKDTHSANHIRKPHMLHITSVCLEQYDCIYEKSCSHVASKNRCKTPAVLLSFFYPRWLGGGMLRSTAVTMQPKLVHFDDNEVAVVVKEVRHRCVDFQHSTPLTVASPLPLSESVGLTFQPDVDV